MYEFESRARRSGFNLVAGVDEAGRGPLAGPVVAAAVVLPADYRNSEIRDSKQLSSKKRDEMYGILINEAVSFGLGVVESSVIDQMNILRASLLAMKEAVMNLSSGIDFLLIDGNQGIDLPIPQQTIIDGESHSISVAAASIIAKVSRDRIMEIYHRQYPQYNFINNKGYGTEEHRRAIKIHGCCKLHRMSFKPVREALSISLLDDTE
ncbi:MAG: ribonuclease HII [Syntrophales bacterium]|nr:ribonuclease HII [Syntrophales bacterium]MDD5234306.1 ribonuclease HII [Syntrophales bacterium]MDD5532482.1 ribonuclease HII [Syntrophales bacterium]